jgi:hypothetical protein
LAARELWSQPVALSQCMGPCLMPADGLPGNLLVPTR